MYFGDVALFFGNFKKFFDLESYSKFIANLQDFLVKLRIIY